jgi:hypothetical protein
MPERERNHGRRFDWDLYSPKSDRRKSGIVSDSPVLRELADLQLDYCGKRLIGRQSFLRSTDSVIVQ